MRYGQLIGQDEAMRGLFGLIGRAAGSDSTILIEGETGTGKELVAAEIHRRSRRARGPYVVFDCGATPTELIESTLFGHVRGAFSGALADHHGAFAEAHGGTIFLDEIGDMALSAQRSLLRFLDTRSIRMVGANHYDRVDVRVIAATHRSLRERVKAGRFREDLYYRLRVIEVSIPPLRERDGDIPLLVQHFLDELSDGAACLTSSDMDCLREHPWPGNVRELRSTVTRAYLRGQGNPSINLIDDRFQEREREVRVRRDLPFKQAKGCLLRRFEQEYIDDLLSRHGTNLSSAAREAQIDRKYLRALIARNARRERLDSSHSSVPSPEVATPNETWHEQCSE